MSARARAWSALGALVVATIAPGARAFCPSYTPAETAGGQSCGVQPAAGHNPLPVDWKPIFAKVSPGKASWGTEGPNIDTMGAGCGKPTVTHAVPAHFPCHVLEAITMQESGWQQFCVPDSPAASVGAPERTIVSFDCGYGVGQVTSGMHVGESPVFDTARVASDPVYNLATGTLILRDKWAGTNCVGDNDPDLVEDWYTAIWAYNGLAYSNNPSNPNLTAGRGVYDPSVGGSYAYQERVLGWMEHPPGKDYWPALAPAYPNPGDVGTAGAPVALPEPSCASPTDCTKKRTTHTSSCAAPSVDGGAPGSDAGSGPKGDAGAGDGATGGPPLPVEAGGAAGGPDGSVASGAAPGSAAGCACTVGRQERRSAAASAGIGVLACLLARRRKSRRGASA